MDQMIRVQPEWFALGFAEGEGVSVLGAPNVQEATVLVEQPREEVTRPFGTGAFASWGRVSVPLFRIELLGVGSFNVVMGASYPDAFAAMLGGASWNAGSAAPPKRQAPNPFSRFEGLEFRER